MIITIFFYFNLSSFAVITLRSIFNQKNVGIFLRQKIILMSFYYRSEYVQNSVFLSYFFIIRKIFFYYLNVPKIR